MNRILTIQDISCIGKCSLTVALPIVSAFGVETAVLPTAILSTHTAFNGFTFHDLTDEISPIKEHWKKENFTFDGIYTGYLGSFRQIDLVAEIFDDFKTNDNFILVDPAMGDNGKLYSGFDSYFAVKMGSLCAKSDVMVPNITESCAMLGLEYPTNGYDEEYIKNILVKLTDLNGKKAVITGVSFDKKQIGVYAYDKLTDTYFSYFRELLPKSFHGTGDVFASALTGAIAKNISFENSLKIAVDYTVKSIQLTIDNPKHNWYGVEFEGAFPMLMDRIR